MTPPDDEPDNFGKMPPDWFPKGKPSLLIKNNPSETSSLWQSCKKYGRQFYNWLPPRPPPITRKEEAATPAFSTLENQVRNYVLNGWRVISDGPTGVQLEGPKVMSSQDNICLILGFAGLLLFGLGIILIVFAVLDHCFFTKPPTVFLPR
jgi:hypothetical protein